MDSPDLRLSTERYDQRRGDVALYIDWENIKYSLWNHDARAPRAAVLRDAASRYGRVVAARAYANWQEPQHQADPSELYSVGIEPIYVPTRTYTTVDAAGPAARRKNSVDVKLTVDAVDLCLMNPNIESFVLVTGDGDFVHLVTALRCRSKQVVVIGCSWSTSWQLTSTADLFVPYDVELDPLPEAKPGELDPAARDSAFAALVEVMHDIRREGQPNGFSQVKLMLALRLGQFDERQLGFGHFRDFMREAEARGLVQTYFDGTIDRAWLPEDERWTGPRQGPGLDSAAAIVSLRPSGQPRVDSAALSGLIVFLDELEQNSPYMSFNFMADRAARSGAVGLTVHQAASLLNAAIDEGVFCRETRTVFSHGGREPHDVNIFRLNRAHPWVMEALDSSDAAAGE